MGFDINELIKSREQKGIYISYSVDVRTVEGFFKRLFGKTDTDQDTNTEDNTNGGQSEDSGRDI